MQSGQFTLIRDVLAFGAALVTLALLFLIIEMNIVVSLAVAVIVFLGMFFILNPQSMQQIAESRLMSTRSKSTGSMTSFRVKVSSLQNMSTRIDAAALRDHILDVAEMSKDIANAIERSPSPPTYVIARLDYAYTLLMKLLGRYIGLMHSADSRDRLHAESLSETLEERVMIPLEQSIRTITADVEQSASRVDISPIDAAVKALEEQVKAEGIV